MQLRDAGGWTWTILRTRYLPELRGAVGSFAAIEAGTSRRMLSYESGQASGPAGRRTDWLGPHYQGDTGGDASATGRHCLDVRGRNAQHKNSDLAYRLLGERVTQERKPLCAVRVVNRPSIPLSSLASGYEQLEWA